MSGEKNPINAWFLLVLPPVVFLAIEQSIGPMALVLDESWKRAVYYLASIIIGIAIFRSARTVRDHEWFRRRHLKSLQKAYIAEDRGVWARADITIAQMEAEAAGTTVGQSRAALERLSGNVGGLVGEATTEEVEEDEDAQVDLLLENELVQRSSSRVSGESGPVESVKGETIAREEPERKSLLSGVGDKVRQAAQASVEKRAAAKQPAAPVAAEVQPEPAPAATDWYAQEMAGVSTGSPGAAPSVASGNRCGACGHANPAGEGYCENCGTRL